MVSPIRLSKSVTVKLSRIKWTQTIILFLFAAASDPRRFEMFSYRIVARQLRPLLLYCNDRQKTAMSYLIRLTVCGTENPLAQIHSDCCRRSYIPSIVARAIDWYALHERQIAGVLVTACLSGLRDNNWTACSSFQYSSLLGRGHQTWVHVCTK